jgi:AcrR family transcriptional regulator
MEKKIDQRVRLTQNLLKHALVQLMKEQHISKISVRAICEVADINRSTFYVHYADPYDLLAKIEEEVRYNLNGYLEKQEFSNNKPISVQILTRILEYVKDNAALFKALLSENCDFAFQKDIMELAQIVSSQNNQSLDNNTAEYIKIFSITGCISIVQKWLQDGILESPVQMSEFVIQILYYGLTSVQKNDLLWPSIIVTP